MTTTADKPLHCKEIAHNIVTDLVRMDRQRITVSDETISGVLNSWMEGVDLSDNDIGILAVVTACEIAVRLRYSLLSADEYTYRIVLLILARRKDAGFVMPKWERGMGYRRHCALTDEARKQIAKVIINIAHRTGVLSDDLRLYIPSAMEAFAQNITDKMGLTWGETSHIQKEVTKTIYRTMDSDLRRTVCSFNALQPQREITDDEFDAMLAEVV